MESKTIWFVLKSVCRPQDYGCHRGCPGSTSKQVFIKCMVWISFGLPFVQELQVYQASPAVCGAGFNCSRSFQGLWTVWTTLSNGPVSLHHTVNYWILWRPFGIFNYEVNPSDKTHSRRWPFGQRFVATLRHFNRQLSQIEHKDGATWCDMVRQLSDFDQNSLIVRLIVFPLRLFPFDADLGRLVIGQSAWKNASRKISP